MQLDPGNVAVPFSSLATVLGESALCSRRSGVLAHVSSLPEGHGIGDAGPAARRFVATLGRHHQSIWQILPLTPPAKGNSPYTSTSAFAGNPLLISLDDLCTECLLLPEELPVPMAGMPADRVDFHFASRVKSRMLRLAYRRYREERRHDFAEEFAAFRDQQSFWLSDFSLFSALKRRYPDRSWNHWPEALARREPAAMVSARAQLTEEIDFVEFVQFLFQWQWSRLHEQARAQGVGLMGDVPIFVSHDSADVWAHARLFALDESGEPTKVAGVPPDSFAPAGQLWGNPLYRWDRMADEGFNWWARRFQRTLQLVDSARIDHFRGFSAYWEIDTTENDAARGRWVQGPGISLFDAVRRQLGPLPLFAEDLGIITPDVDSLRENCGFPGTLVMQFAFGDNAGNRYLPHNHKADSVVYSGTHDNDTTVSWYEALPDWHRHNVRAYLGTDDDEVVEQLLRCAMRSVAKLTVLPLQDVMRLDGSARMNTPGTASGNWTWRYVAQPDHEAYWQQLSEWTVRYGRIAY